MSHTTDPVEKGIEIPASFFTGTDEYFDVLEHARDNDISFLPRSITIDSNGSDADATTATVRGILWNENEMHIKTRTLSLNQQLPRRYKRIYRVGTTARGIEFNA